MDLEGVNTTVEADNAQATDIIDSSAPDIESSEALAPAEPAQPVIETISAGEASAQSPPLNTEVDTIMTEAPDQAEPHAEAQAPTSDMTTAEKTDESGSSSKVRPREDDEEDGSPASKRAKLEDDETVPSEFKVPEVPPSAAAVEEDGVQNASAATDESTISISALPPAPQVDTEPLTTAQNKALAELLKNAKKVKDAKSFLKPVDHVALGLPTYPEIVQNPMDLETIEKKLKGSQYTSAADLVSDFDLMVQNAHTFNGPQHVVAVSGSNLQAYFRKGLHKIPARDAPPPAPPEKKPKRPSVGARQAPDAPRRPSRISGGPARSPTVEKSNEAFALGPDGTPVIRRDSTLGDRPKREIHRPAKDLPYSSAKPRRKKFQQELRFVDHVVAEMNKGKYQPIAWPFSTAVDPVALNIPTYFSVIKKPMDFGTITIKSKTNQYENARDFKSDVDLMFDNCFRFNPPGDNIHQLGKQYQDVFKKLWAEKDDWIAENTMVSGPQSPGMTPDSDDEDADDEEGEEEDEREVKLRQIQQQIAALSQQAEAVIKGPGNKKPSPKAPSRKNSNKVTKPSGKGARKSGSLAGPGAKAVAKPLKKSAKVKPLTQDEKTEIQEKVERLTEEQPEKAGDLVKIIKENDPKFTVSKWSTLFQRTVTDHTQTLAEDEIELELEELEVDVARMLLKYVRKYYPQPKQVVDDDDFEEPERRAAKNAAATSSRKKNKPMTKVQQETDMSAIRDKLNQYGNPMAAGEQSSDPQQQDESDDDDSGSESEEE